MFRSLKPFTSTSARLLARPQLPLASRATILSHQARFASDDGKKTTGQKIQDALLQQGEVRPDSESSTILPDAPDSIRPDKSKLAEEVGTGNTIRGGKGEHAGPMESEPGKGPQGVTGI